MERIWYYSTRGCKRMQVSVPKSQKKQFSKLSSQAKKLFRGHSNIGNHTSINIPCKGTIPFRGHIDFNLRHRFSNEDVLNLLFALKTYCTNTGFEHTSEEAKNTIEWAYRNKVFQNLPNLIKDLDIAIKKADKDYRRQVESGKADSHADKLSQHNIILTEFHKEHGYHPRSFFNDYNLNRKSCIKNGCNTSNDHDAKFCKNCGTELLKG